MNKEKLELLMEILETTDINILKTKSPINIDTDEFNNMDNNDFVFMVNYFNYLASLDVEKILKERSDI